MTTTTDLPIVPSKVIVARIDFEVQGERFLLNVSPDSAECEDFTMVLMHNGEIIDDRGCEYAAEAFELLTSKRFFGRIAEYLKKPGQRFDILM